MPLERQTRAARTAATAIAWYVTPVAERTTGSSTQGERTKRVCWQEAVKKLRAHKAGAGAAAGRVAFLEVLLFVVFVWSGAS